MVYSCEKVTIFVPRNTPNTMLKGNLNKMLKRKPVYWYSKSVGWKQRF